MTSKGAAASVRGNALIDLEELTPEVISAARRVAEEITHLRAGLERDYEAIRARGPGTGYARNATQRRAERSKINGMVIALTLVLGRGNDMHLAEEFIKDSDTWMALL